MDDADVAPEPVTDDERVEPDTPWPVCGSDGCRAARLAGSTGCWNHAGDARVGTALLELAGGAPLEGRGVRFDEALLDRIERTLPHGDGQRPIVRQAAFDQAVVPHSSWFREAVFRGRTSFAGAVFEGAGDFRGADFEGPAVFTGATFRGPTAFPEATFARTAVFDRCRFEAPANFREVVFERDADFIGARFDALFAFGDVRVGGTARMIQATFAGEAFFSGAVFAGPAWFYRSAFRHPAGIGAWFLNATFHGETDFGQVMSEAGVVFDNATFHGPSELGPMLVKDQFSLRRVTFRERVQVNVAAAQADARDARFAGGGRLDVRAVEISLEGADLAAPAVLSGVQRDFGEQSFGRDADVWDRQVISGSLPLLRSLEQADVAGLLVAGVDLSGCRFTGAHNLDRLRVESAEVFPRTPGWQAGWGWPPVWRWTGRRVLAEERDWRDRWERGIRRQDWKRDADAQPGFGRRGRAQEVATLYRALRKGREDQKDEPGSADFYYGEMEMRRAAAGPGAEKLILTLYWLVSGYALRASRALAAALAALLVAAALFTWTGFADPMSYGDALLFSARTAVGLPNDPAPALTAWGSVTQIGVRVVVPVLLGLAVLSIRGRVRR
jgi:uncharacterized protein YjbI with pentapeptide repeats